MNITESVAKRNWLQKLSDLCICSPVMSWPTFCNEESKVYLSVIFHVGNAAARGLQLLQQDRMVVVLQRVVLATVRATHT